LGFGERRIRESLSLPAESTRLVTTDGRAYLFSMVRALSTGMKVVQQINKSGVVHNYLLYLIHCSSLAQGFFLATAENRAAARPSY